MPSVLFVCVANSFRSQIAEAAARTLSRGTWTVWSAGSHPGGGVHPAATRLLAEIGMDPAGQRSKGLDELPALEWDYVVTMGCGDACPAIPARRRLDWALPDPAALGEAEARRVRDEIVERVRHLITHPIA
jgi:protein-tyrosine-phosphatase